MSLAALAYARRSLRVFGSGADAYAIGGSSPKLVLDFVGPLSAYAVGTNEPVLVLDFVGRN